MPTCQNCRTELSPRDLDRQQCTSCGARLAVDADPWVPVARIVNLAEVGYFSDLLQSDGVETDVLQHDEFSALDGSWQSLFLLRVRQSQQHQAAQSLQASLSGSAAPIAADEAAAEFASTHQRTGWQGLAAVTLVLASLTYAVMYGAVWRQRAGEAAPETLEAFLHAQPGTWVQLADDGARRELRYDAARKSYVLWEDADGDGRPDRRRRFAAR